MHDIEILFFPGFNRQSLSPVVERTVKEETVETISCEKQTDYDAIYEEVALALKDEGEKSVDNENAINKSDHSNSIAEDEEIRAVSEKFVLDIMKNIEAEEDLKDHHPSNNDISAVIPVESEVDGNSPYRSNNAGGGDASGALDTENIYAQITPERNGDAVSAASKDDTAIVVNESVVMLMSTKDVNNFPAHQNEESMQETPAQVQSRTFTSTPDTNNPTNSLDGAEQIYANIGAIDRTLSSETNIVKDISDVGDTDAADDRENASMSQKLVFNHKVG